MAAGPAVKKVVVPTALVTVTSAALAVVINLVTDGKHSAWLGVAAAALAVISFLGSLWLYRRQQDSQGPTVAAGSNVVGDVGGNISIRADGSSAAALQMGDVHFGNTTTVDPQTPGGQSN
ncbi:hypothetical protein [Rhodococcus wratislaviensis]|uniref:Uncharacterized protein n=1 Tax=Rhodococcus wratislaviensis NBRC 100605 TaxID=1219028 RepID=X0PZM5_RHOWR|nr:hypothetical protein [Rhodococcus wratislaviensis]GAF49154.1 hypothetical protein RW1_069_00220 [Rhodococcus wratislaviensis NBRC 100605]